MTSELKAQLDQMVQENKVLVFMKGTKLMPMCGFSNNVVQILNSLGVPFETVNVLENEAIRQGIKEYSNWPTIPQVYINGEFVGGSDILIELYQSNELQEMLEVALAS
jgi:monothiol glutaredoxin